jgi:hypothetical protein
MKKLAVLSIALLMLTTLVFAEVMVEPTVEFSGSGTLTWGIDLDNSSSTGFANTSSANLTVTLVPASTETKGGMEGDMVYGYISLSDMSLIFDSDNNKDLPADMALGAAVAVDPDGDAATVDDRYVYAPDGDTISVPTAFLTAPAVEAYVMLGPAKWFIYGAEDMAISYAGVLEDDSDDDYWAEGEETDGIDTDATGDFGAGSTGIEIAAGPATITALIASSKDWDDDTSTATTYGAAAKVGLTAGPATIDAGVNFDFDTSNIGFGGSVGLTAGPAEISVGFDGVSMGSTLTYELAAGVTLTLPDVLELTANLAYGDVWNMDAEIGATLTAVPDLSFSALVGLWNLSSGLSWGINANTAFKIGMGETNYVKPGVNLYLSTPDGGTMRVVLIGTVEAVLISNTTFLLTWKSTDLTGGTTGTLTFATTVEY